jgi:hypothetical protein
MNTQPLGDMPEPAVEPAVDGDRPDEIDTASPGVLDERAEAD